MLAAGKLVQVFLNIHINFYLLTKGKGAQAWYSTPNTTTNVIEKEMAVVYCEVFSCLMDFYLLGDFSIMPSIQSFLCDNKTLAEFLSFFGKRCETMLDLNA